MMKSVARKVTLSLAEAKRFSVINQEAIPSYVGSLSNSWTLKNPFAAIPIAIDAQSFGRVGAEIVDPMIKLKYTFKIPWFSNVNVNSWGTWHFSVALISANDNFTNSTFLPYDFGSTDPIWFLNSAVGRTTWNGNNINVLKIWHRSYTPDEIVLQTQAGVTNQVYGQSDIVGKLYYKWKGKKTFEDVAAVPGFTAPNYPSGTLLKGTNYFVMVGWQAPGTIPFGNRPSCQVDTFMYFKDP